MEGKRYKEFLEKLKPLSGDYIVGYDKDTLEEIRIPVSSLAVQGSNGAGLQVQYCNDGKSWHYPYQEGDMYMRQRIGIESWTDAIRIATPKIIPAYQEVKRADDGQTVAWDANLGTTAFYFNDKDSVVAAIDNAEIGKSYMLIVQQKGAQMSFKDMFIFPNGDPPKASIEGADLYEFLVLENKILLKSFSANFKIG